MTKKCNKPNIEPIRDKSKECREIWDRSGKGFHEYILGKAYAFDYDYNPMPNAGKRWKELKPKARTKICRAIRMNEEDYYKALYEEMHDL